MVFTSEGRPNTVNVPLGNEWGAKGGRWCWKNYISGVSWWLASLFWHPDTLPPKALQDIVTYTFVTCRWQLPLTQWSPKFKARDNSSCLLTSIFWWTLTRVDVKSNENSNELVSSLLLNGFRKCLYSYWRLRSGFLCILRFTHRLCKKFAHVPNCIRNAINM